MERVELLPDPLHTYLPEFSFAFFLLTLSRVHVFTRMHFRYVSRRDDEKYISVREWYLKRGRSRCEEMWRAMYLPLRRYFQYSSHIRRTIFRHFVVTRERVHPERISGAALRWLAGHSPFFHFEKYKWNSIFFVYRPLSLRLRLIGSYEATRRARDMYACIYMYACMRSGICNGSDNQMSQCHEVMISYYRNCTRRARQTAAVAAQPDSVLSSSVASNKVFIVSTAGCAEMQFPC